MQRSALTLPSLSALRGFEAAVRLGSFKAAARELHVTESALSHQVHVLEAHFGAKLFLRQGNRLVLTQEGALYGTEVSKSFADLSKASEIFTRDRQPIVRVSASPTFAMFAALPNVARFKSFDPTLDLHLEARNTEINFDLENIDAAIQVGHPPFPGLSSQRLFHSRLGPLAHPDVVRKFGRLESAADIARMPLIELNHIPGLWELWFAKAAPDIKLNELSLSCDSLLAAIQMAENGGGVLLAPFPLTGSLVKTRRLVTVSPIFVPVHDNDFYLLYRKSDVNSAKIKAIRRWLKAIVGEIENSCPRSDA